MQVCHSNIEQSALLSLSSVQNRNRAGETGLVEGKTLANSSKSDFMGTGSRETNRFKVSIKSTKL